MHVAIAVVVPGFLALCAWQVTRALSGNTLSWAYVFEWPIFAAYALFMWWKLTHEASAPSSEADSAGANVATAAATHLPVDLVADTAADAASDPAADTAPGVAAGSAESAGAHEGGRHNRGEDDTDEELARYNEYLAALNASGRRKHW